MDWELVVDILSDYIKDESLRSDIYRKMIEESEDFDGAKECLGNDSVFDKIYEEVYEEYDDSDSKYADDNDEFGYDD